ncbi:MAG: DUF2865 domain-containing protein [Devosia sp.]|nr:DUF2865 domain-containing protein [Devosia sp.]
MLAGWRIGSRAGAVLLVLAGFIGLDGTAALAQSATCAQLNATLQGLDRNRDFRSVDQTSGNAQQLQSDERAAESAYVSAGCQSAQRQGFPQTPECRSLAHQILQSRAQLAQLSQSIANGNGVAQQREAVLQEIARFGCNQRAPGLAGGQQQQRPRNFLEELFGGPSRQDNYGDTFNGQEQVNDPYANQQTGNTIRTVCVRASDGYYWPISYATVRDYIPQDADTCAQECPGQQVDLYYYDNPGQEPEQMVNAQGQAYTSLPTAFAYRKQFDRSNTCKPQEIFGTITLDGDGQKRAMVSYNGDTFPLPIRDPRSTEQATTLPAKYAEIVDIPLPRPRPSSTAPAADVLPATEPVVSVPNRTVQVGDKIVRIVGPDTPYAPATLPGTSG